MSGHSKWSTIKHKKGAKDARRGKLFTKLIREITVAAKMGGEDTDANPRLRSAVNTARASNMPSDTIARAIKKGVGGNDGVDYEEIIYEGYGPQNAAVIVEALTDNRNRTASSVRATFTKYNGNLGSTNSVLYMFDHVGLISIDKSAVDEDTLTEHILEAGADDLEDDGDRFVVRTTLEQYDAVKTYLEQQGLQIAEAELAWQPQNKLAISDAEQAEKLIAFLEALEDDDDVQKVHTNLDFDESVLAQMEAS